MGYLLLNRKSDKQFLPQQEVAECFNGAKVINIFGFINKSSFLNLKATLLTINLVEISLTFSITSKPFALSVEPVSTISTMASEIPVTGPSSTEPSNLIISTSSCLMQNIF